MLQGAPGVDGGRLASAVRDAVGADRAVLADTTALAERLFGTHLPANVVLLGIAAQLGALPVPPAASSTPSRPRDRRRPPTRGLPLGPLARRRPGRGRGRPGRIGPVRVHRPGGDLGPDAVGGRAAASLLDARPLPRRAPAPRRRRAAQVVDYQGCGWPSAGSTSSPHAAADDAEHDWELTEAVAEGWFKVLTYKDEYEVARLHLQLDLDEVAADLGHRRRVPGHTTSTRRCSDGWAWIGRWPSRGRRWPACSGALAAMRKGAGHAARPVRPGPAPAGGAPARRRVRRARSGALDAVTPATYDPPSTSPPAARRSKGYEDIKSDAIARWRRQVARHVTQVVRFHRGARSRPVGGRRAAGARPAVA